MARLLVSAAAHAGARGAPEAAAAYLARALTEPPAPERVNEVHVALGAAELAAGRPGAGAEHLRAALAGDLPAQVRARGAIDLAHALWADSDVRGALAALEEHKRSLDARWALRLDVERATLGALAAEHAPEALRRMRGYRCLTPDSPAERLALALAAFGMAVDPASTAEEAASVALRALGNGRLLGEQDTYPPAHALALWVLLTAERLDAADAEVRRLAEHSSHRASRHALAVASVAAAFASGARGELSSALALAATEVERVLELPPGPMRGRLLSGAIQVLAEAFLARGDVGAAGIAIERGQAEGDPTSLELVPVRYARAALRLAQGDDEAALWEFLACGETYEAAGWEDRLVPWRGGAAEACARLGRIEDAVRLADELLALARGWGAPVAIARALRVRALTGPAGDAIALLTEADALLDGSYARLEHARALAELGSVLGREHRTTDAHRVLKRALSLAGRCGATAVEQRCVRELRRWS